MRLTRILLLAAGVFLAQLAHADEGMWLLPLIKKYNLDSMVKLGLQISPESIYDVNHASLKDAVVIFGNGCTGEVISDKGLVLTNHHCGYEAIQQHSTVEHDYLKDGFWAMSMADEIPTPGLSVTFLVSMEDVTDAINAKLTPEMGELERWQTISRVGDSLAEAAKGDSHYETTVESYYGGNQFFLLTYEKFTDIRMVGAPPSSIGKFGADTDNWMYPRHTGDFSMFRIYANKDNKPADYSKDNVPYKPRKYLSVSIAGYKEGDFTMILGNPGHTQRYMTSYEVLSTIDVTNTDRAYIRGIKQAVWKKHMDADPAIRIKYSSKYAQSANYWKNSIGQNEALKRLDVVNEKRKEESEFANWLSGSPDRVNLYGSSLEMIHKGVEEFNGPLHTLMYYSEALRGGMEFNRLAQSYVRLAQALKINDTATIRDLQVMTDSLMYEEHFKDYDASTDRESSAAMLRLFKEKMSADALPSFYQLIDKKYSGNIDKFINKLFATSIFVNYEKLKAFMRKPTAKALENDLGFQVANATRKGMDRFRNETFKAREMISKGQRLYIAGRLAMLNGAPSYPDANFTMRLTYGTVKGYSPRDAVDYKYYTTLEGVMEKDDPTSWEFAVSEKLKSLHFNKDYDFYTLPDGRMPVNFLSTNDITGGNSGSPVLNAYGQLIGCAFDGNWESLSGDIAFEKELQRCINVDIRYVLFVISKYAGCQRLIEEMDIVR